LKQVYKDLCLGTLNIIRYFEIDYFKTDYSVVLICRECLEQMTVTQTKAEDKDEDHRGFKC